MSSEKAADDSVDPREKLDAMTGHGPVQFTDTRRPMPRGARGFLILSMALACVVIALVLWRTWGPKPGDDALFDPLVTRSGISNTLQIPEVRRAPQAANKPEPEQVQPQPEIPVIVGMDEPAPMQINEVTLRRLGSSLTGANQQGASETASASDEPTSSRGDSGPLADQLRPLELQPSVAGQLGDRNFLLTQGSMIDCVMQTRLETSQAGMLTCIATQDVMSANGNVVLVDAGTKFTGYQSSGIVQGQARAFITWNRLETPQGVIVNLESPGTGPLGEAGVDGKINHHFWQRFGNAILLSLVGDLGNWASNRGNRGDNNIRFDTTRDGAQEIVAKVLEHSVDIPPTLYKNQGERVGIVVARDLDFSHVYALKPKS